MDQRITVIGAGNLALSPHILAALAQYFGERPVEVALFDADAERLELADRLARRLFEVTENESRILATSDLGEAVGGAVAVIICYDENCARHFVAPRREAPPHAARPTDWAYETWPTVDSQPWEDVDPDDAILRLEQEVLDQLEESVSLLRIGLDWTPKPVAEEPSQIPHLVLRWARADEPVDTLLAAGIDNPIKKWICRHLC